MKEQNQLQTLRAAEQAAAENLESVTATAEAAIVSAQLSYAQAQNAYNNLSDAVWSGVSAPGVLDSGNGRRDIPAWLQQPSDPPPQEGADELRARKAAKKLLAELLANPGFEVNRESLARALEEERL
jgi:hypothetical protein